VVFTGERMFLFVNPFCCVRCSELSVLRSFQQRGKCQIHYLHLFVSQIQSYKFQRKYHLQAILKCAAGVGLQLKLLIVSTLRTLLTFSITLL